MQSLKAELVRRATDLARWRGYDLTPHWNRDSRPLALHLAQLLELYAIDCVLDVGANLGQYHDFLRHDVGWRGTILSFEPVGRYVAHLRARGAEDSRWHVLDYALGSDSKDAVINVTASPGLNSFLEPSAETFPEIWAETSITHREQVRIERLDGMLGALKAEYGFKRPYLKLDTQGFDLEALRGAGACLAGIPALQTEASIKPLYLRQPNFVETIEFLNGEGFVITGFFPVTRDVSLRLVEFDCVMINNRFARSAAIP